MLGGECCIECWLVFAHATYLSNAKGVIARNLMKSRLLAPGASLDNIAARLSLEAAWVRAGGVFIHHTSASTSLAKLKALLPAEPPREDAEPEGAAEGSAKRQKRG